MEKKALAVQAKKKDDAAECYLYGDIGGFDGITGDTFRAAIEGLGEFRSLTMYVNSGGGSVFEGKAIVAQLERVMQRAKVTAVVDALAASAASFVAVSCHEVVMHASAKMMVHLPYAVAAGNASDLRKMADLLDSESDSLVAIYAKKTGKKADELRSMLENETWMTAEEAVSAKFADRIAGATKPKNETSVFTDLVAETKARITNTDEVKRLAALSRSQRVVETMRAETQRNQK